MAVELAPMKIGANCIAPVMGQTGLFASFMGIAGTAENRAKFVAKIPWDAWRGLMTSPMRAFIYYSMLRNSLVASSHQFTAAAQFNACYTPRHADHAIGAFDEEETS